MEDGWLSDEPKTCELVVDDGTASVEGRLVMAGNDCETELSKLENNKEVDERGGILVSIVELGAGDSVDCPLVA